jgi:hypothetical protein
MARLFFILFGIGVFTSPLVAQISFSLTPNPQRFITVPNEPVNESYAKVTNLDARPDTLRWERRVISVTDGCTTQVCDPLACYAAFVNTERFPLPGNATINLGIWLQNPQAKQAAAVVHLKVTNISNPRDSVTAVFLFIPRSVGTEDDLPAPTVRLSPNPATEYLTLQHADAVQQLRLLTTDGREVARYTATPGQQYPVGHLTPGTYIVLLEDKTGRVFQAGQFVR